jgi:hypothetical protein
MILINFTHPLNDSQLTQLGKLLDEPLTEPLDVPAQFDAQAAFSEQVSALVDSVGLSSRQWQSERILINPPAFAPIASSLVAELHGRMGYFPTLIRLRPVPGVTPPTYEVAELIDLQAIRDSARKNR